MPSTTRPRAELLVIQDLLGAFDERDQTKRLAQMQCAYAADITFHDPNKIVAGFDAIDEMASQLLGMTLKWEFGPNSETTSVRGNNIIIVNGDGKIWKMYTMIEGVTDHPLGGGSGV